MATEVWKKDSPHCDTVQKVVFYFLGNIEISSDVTPQVFTDYLQYYRKCKDFHRNHHFNILQYSLDQKGTCLHGAALCLLSYHVSRVMQHQQSYGKKLLT